MNTGIISGNPVFKGIEDNDHGKDVFPISIVLSVVFFLSNVLDFCFHFFR